MGRLAYLKVGALGDLLIGTAALKESCEKYPSHKVWVMGDKLWLQILSPQDMSALWPQVDGIVVIEKNKSFFKFDMGQLFKLNPEKTEWVAADAPYSLNEFFKYCDVTVNTRYESYRFAWGPWFLGVKERYGSCPKLYKWFYTHWASWLGKDPLIHERDLILRILGEDLIKKWKGKGLPALKTPDIDNIQKLTGSAVKKYVLLNPTASRWEKAWPKEKFRELALKLKIHFLREGVDILIIGSPKETTWLKEVAQEDFNVVQPATIFDLMDVVAGAKLLVANTSSMQFIAASTNTPVLTLMGQAPKEIWGPLGEKDQSLRGQVPSDFKGTLFEKDYAAYDFIPVDGVYKMILRMLIG